MKLPRSAIGQEVIIKWRDPAEGCISRRTIEEIPDPLCLAAFQETHGRILRIRDGWVLLLQTQGRHATEFDGRHSGEYSVAVIHEELIQEDGVIYFDARKKEVDNGP